MDLLEPSGELRATLPAGASVEALLGAAWGLREGLDRIVAVSVPDGWELALYRQGAIPRTQRLGVVTKVRDGNKQAMLETAWAELLDEGWSIR
jgi:hypothetical protein